MITCTSEISGRASSGIWPMDQIPASVSSNTPVKTRNRLCAHHSMIREIMIHTPRGIQCHLLAGNRLPILLRADAHLPSAAGAEVTFSFVHSAAFVGSVDYSFHRGHSHG